MKLFCDTSVLVDVDRKREETLRLLELASRRDDVELWISTITVSEILMGAHLRKDAEKAVLRAHRILGQFVWQEFDGAAADRTARLLAELHITGARVEYQDAAIAGCALVAHADHLVTEDKAHFARFPPLKDKARTAVEMRKRL